MEGHFREDLFFRINVINITIPPLRERRDQILPLSEYFLDIYKKKYGKEVPPFSPEVINALKEYHWPGNIRELENMIKRIAIFEDGSALLKNISDKRLVGDGIHPESYKNLSPTPRKEKKFLKLKEVGKRAAEDAEKEIIQNALQETHWNRKDAAILLHVSYKALLYKIQKYHLNNRGEYRRVEEERI
jgi:two-component system response regulator AtoC